MTGLKWLRLNMKIKLIKNSDQQKSIQVFDNWLCKQHSWDNNLKIDMLVGQNKTFDVMTLSLGNGDGHFSPFSNILLTKWLMKVEFAD